MTASAVGRPINVEKCEKPTLEQLHAVQKEYIEELYRCGFPGDLIVFECERLIRLVGYGTRIRTRLRRIGCGS